MTNTLNTPIEALEYQYPFRVLEYGVRRGSGGDGRFRGGDGLIRTVEFLGDATVSLLTERRSRGAWGLAGGGDGAPGRNTMRRIDEDTEGVPCRPASPLTFMLATGLPLRHPAVVAGVLPRHNSEREPGKRRQHR